MNGPQKIDLENLGGGAAKELFQRELERVIKNIEDINTPAKEAREINLKVIFKPNDQRDAGIVELKCTSKLSGTRAETVPMLMIKENGKEVMYQQVYKQAALDFDDYVVPLKGEENA